MRNAQVSSAFFLELPPLPYLRCVIPVVCERSQHHHTV